MIRFKLAAANKILVQVGVKVRAEYSRNVKENFQSSLMRTDFGEPIVVVALINAWVEEQPRGTIKDLVSTEMLTRKARMMLINTIYFKATLDVQHGQKAFVSVTEKGTEAGAAIAMVLM